MSGLATGAAIVALAAVGGFPDLAAAEAPAWVGPTKLILDPILLYFEVAFVARIILSWYPQVSRRTSTALSDDFVFCFASDDICSVHVANLPSGSCVNGMSS